MSMLQKTLEKFRDSNDPTTKVIYHTVQGLDDCGGKFNKVRKLARVYERCATELLRATESTEVTLNRQELATVLAALRFFQADWESADTLHTDHFNEVEPLTDKEIDQFCHRINE